MTIVPAQIEFAERAKAARARMAKAALSAAKIAPPKTLVIDVFERSRQQRAALAEMEAGAEMEAERIRRIVSAYRLATDTIANPKMQVARIKRETAEKHGVTAVDIDGPRRSVKIVRARHEAMWRAHRETSLTLTPLAKLFNRDHTTFLWGIRQHEARMAGTSISRVGGTKLSLARQKEAT